jgi:hemerythrin-like domain-containing protein
MPSVFDVLHRDHEEVKWMLTLLENGPTAATSATSKELSLRRKMVENLVIAESKHEAAEEMYFWPVVRERLAAAGDKMADRAVAQEQEGKEVLDALDKLGPEQPDFELLAAAFIKAGREHIAYEEDTVWPPLRTALSPEEAEDLGAKLELAKLTAPTRPHPRTSPKPGVLKTAGPAVAAADRFRDAVTGRGQG